METFTRQSFDAETIAQGLLTGDGVVLLKDTFPRERIARFKACLDAETEAGVETGSHFNQSEEEAALQRSIWFTRLVALDPGIADLVEDPMIVEAMRRFLGTEFVMGSLCASRIMPGFKGQQPHVDYPYWDIYRRDTFPREINASFPLNAQAIILIDAFTAENGATALVPGSQHMLRYPEPADGFMDCCIRLTGEPGDVVLFNGAAWHCAMPNASTASRMGLLVEFLPKFVKPIEDMLTGLDPAFLERASPVMKQLLGFRYPWPSTPPEPPMSYMRPPPDHIHTPFSPLRRA
ncbi:MAG: phytanoyl-CoA dioxygenase family protein [Pseudomonadota bacterium]